MKLRVAAQYMADVLLLWGQDRLPLGDALKTRQRRLSAAKRFCRDHDMAEPVFAKVAVKHKVTKDMKRGSFKVHHVISLASKSEANGDLIVAHLITLALHTGARLEELATLKVTSVDTSDWTMSVSSKTDAGNWGCRAAVDGLWACGLGVCRGGLHVGFVIHGRAISQSRMEPHRVVSAFDVAEAGYPGFGL